MYSSSTVTYPLTDAQKRIWYTENFYPGLGITTIGGTVRIKTEQPFDTELMRQAIQHYVRLHDTARLRMLYEPGSEPKQYVAPYRPFHIDIVDMTGSGERELEAWADEEFRKPMPFYDADLFEFKIARVGEFEGWYIIKMNHTVSDATGMVLANSEILDIYVDLIAGKGEPEGPRPSYVEYIQIDEQYRTSDRYQKDKQFWNEKFATIPEFTSLKPADSYNIRTEAERELFAVPQELEQRIRAFCQEHNLGILTLFLAVLYTYCYRLTGHQDLVLGTFFANRTNAKEKQLPGMFVSTTPMRVLLEPEADFISFARNVFKEQMLVLRHQKYPYNSILNDIKTRRPDVNSLFGLTLEYVVMGWQEKDGMSYVAQQHFVGHEINDLAVSVKDRYDTGELQIAIDYRKEMFSSEDIHRICRHLLMLVEDAVVHPDKKLAELELCPPEEKRLILEQFNATDADMEPGLTTIAAFERQVERVPERIAVKCGDARVTYRELNERANRLARALAARGVGRDDRVAILLDRKPLMVECILAIWKAGGAYVPVDPEYPQQRILDMISDSGARVVLTESGFVTGELKDALSACEFYELDLAAAELEQLSAANLDVVVAPEQLAYMIYTSGSTGKPKGAMLEHAGMLNHIDAMVEELCMDEWCVMAQNAPHCFDISVWQFVTALTLGGTTAIYPNELILNPRAFIAEVEQDGVTVLEVVVSFMAALLEMELDVKLSALRYLLVTGEAAKPHLVRRWFERYTHVKVVNAYGPTEACDDITLHILDRAPESEVMPIGKPVRNLKVYVVDERMNLMPIGVVGELCVSGIGVGRGYMNDPEKTAKAFREDPFRQERGVRLYKTGDLARWLPDGTLEYMGRIDHQVKIRGHRIECGDIEARLMKHEAIKETLVIDRTDDGGNKYLCAYLTGARELSPAELREFVAAELPNYMVPSYFIQLEAFPLTPNGKIDRRALPVPDHTAGGSATEYAAPRTELEHKLAAIWQSVLGVDRVGVHDHYFELGGDSLKAMLIMAGIYKQFGVELPLRELFEKLTVAGLAGSLERILQDPGTNRYEPIAPVERQELYPVSSAQKRMYLLNLMEDESSLAYNMPGMIAIDGPLEIDRLNGAMQALVNRHESLRTSFVMVDGVPFQKVHDQAELDIPYIEATEEQLRGISDSFIRPFDLTVAPLLRLQLVKLGEERHSLFIDMHHIISDGVSVQMFLQQFSALYRGLELPELKVQYKEYSAWHNRLLESDALREQEAYWLKQFAGELPVLDLPTDNPRPPMQSFEGDRFWFHAGAELTEAVRQAAAKTGTTTYMVLLAAYQVLLHKYTSQEDIVVGTPIAGRTHPDTEGIFGMFVNSLAVRAFPKPELTFAEFVQNIKGTLFEAYERQEYPLDVLIERLDLGRDTSRNPLFDTMFVHLANDIVDIEFDGLKFKIHELDEGISKFDLLIEALEWTDNIRFKLQFCTALFRKETMDRLAVHYVNVLRAVTMDPNVTLGSIDMLAPEEKEQMLDQARAASAEAPSTASIVPVFERLAAAEPNRPAIVCDGIEWTYGSLNDRANRLAKTLSNHVPGHGGVAVLLADESAETFIGLLAILKAGLIAAPIAASSSADFVSSVLQDCGAQAVLGKGIEAAVHADAFFGIAVDLRNEDMFAADGGSLPAIGNPDDAALLMYGAQGRDFAGLMLTHRQVLARLRMDEGSITFGADDVWTVLHKPDFELSLWEWFGALLTGGKLVLAPTLALNRTAESILALLAAEAVTVVCLTPSEWRELVRLEAPNGAESGLRLRNVLVGGEPVRPFKLRASAGRFAGIKVTALYGLPEACGCVAYSGFGDAIAEIRQSSSAIFVVDRNAQLVPYGVAGELVLGGDTVGTGYWNRPELTEQRFVTNPFTGETRLYRTGVWAKRSALGEIYVLGDVGQLVYDRSCVVDLGAVEAALADVPGVADAVVLAAQDGQGMSLSAYYVGETDLDEADLRDRLAERLPAHLVPAVWVRLERLPLTADGKLAVDLLSAPLAAPAAVEAGHSVSLTETEKRLAAIWKEILGTAELGPHDDFFRSGGHSLSAATLAARILKEFKTKIPLRTIFKNSTIAELAARIDEKSGTAAPREREKTEARATAAEASNIGGGEAPLTDNKIRPAAVQAAYPLSSAQKRLFVLDRLEGAGTAYNIPAAMMLEGAIDAVRLQRAFVSLIQRHESLRTSFKLVDGEPRQLVRDEAEFALEIGETSEELVNVAIDRFVRPFDLGQAPLIRVGLVKVTDRTNRHVLLVDMHHIVSDGISIALIVSELMRLYAGETLPPLELQYKDYAVWQRSWTTSDDCRNQERVWAEMLSGELPVLELPYDYQRPPVQSFEGDMLTAGIDDELRAALNRLAAQSGATLYMVMLAAYQVLLARYSRQEDIIVGTPVAGRPGEETAGIVGMFVNTLPIRSQPESGLTFQAFLEQVKERTLLAFEHQQVPFEDLLEKLNVRRDLSRNPLFDTMFSLNNIEMEKLEFAGVNCTPYPVQEKIAKADLSLDVRETEQGLHLVLEYCTKLFRRESAERMLNHYVEVLRSVTADPTVELGAVELMTEQEKRQIVESFNATAGEYPQDKTVHRLIEEQAERTPDAIAVAFGDASLTYAELNGQANRLARKLRAYGVGADRLVGLMLPRSERMLVALLAVLKAGGAYVPIDPEYPADRIALMLEDSDAQVLLTCRALEGAADYSRPIVYVDDPGSYADDASQLEEASQAGHLAYVIYTSGSTGRPKGVMLEHRTVNNFIHAMQRTFEFEPGVSMLCLTTISFDIFVLETLYALSFGLRVVMASEAEQRDPQLLAQLVRRERIDVMQTTPSRMQLIRDSAEGLACLAGLRAVLVGGEAFPRLLLADLKRATRARIYNMYGPTETTVWSMVKDLTDEEHINIGYPILNTQVYIVNERLQLLPVGVPGELVIAGDGLARGYKDREELTAEKFAPNPFRPGTKLYRTGDLARWLPDGSLEYIGRSDYQVKVRGYRIELGELEAVLALHPQMKQSAVIDRTDAQGNKYLCAYVVTETPEAASELRKFMADRLPAYMVPSYFIELADMPLTPNGKVNRKALPELSMTAAIGTAEYVEPRTALEKAVAQLWQDALQVQRVGALDHFFELGGHSLKAMSLLAKTNAQFGVDVPLRTLFETPTVEAMSAYIEAALAGSGQQTADAPIRSEAKRDYYPLSSAQKRIYILQQFEGNESTSYNMPDAMWISGTVDTARLEAAFRELIRRHASLRTSFTAIDGEAVQVVHEERDIPFAIEYRECDENEAVRALADFVRPFDLAAAPLLRVGLAKVGGQRCLLMVDMHHIVTDGSSIRILLEEFAMLYRGLALPELPVQYTDYAIWSNDRMQSLRMEAMEAYWLDRLSGDIPVLMLPTDYARPAVQSFDGDRISFSASPELFGKLQRIGAATGTTTYMVLLAAFYALLHKYSGQSDIVVGTPVAGRTSAAVQQLIGMFVGTLALRARPEAGMSFRDLLLQVRELSLEALEHQEYPFEQLIDKLAIRRDLSRNPLFDVMFSHQAAAQAEMAFDGLVFSPCALDNKTAKFDLSLDAYESETHLTFELEYATKLFSRATAESVAEHYVQLLEAVAADPQLRLMDIDMLTEKEKRRLLVEFNDTKRSYPQDATFHRAFEAQAARTPNLAAVTAGGVTLTYEELNRRANALAHVLRSKGVGPDRIVGVMIGRSVEMITAALAVMKAGGAYLPIDPEYPRDRIEYLLEDSRSSWLVTERALLPAATFQGDIVVLEDALAAGEAEENVTAGDEAAPHHLAYIIYTSGTTGKPKGVMIEHRQYMNVAYAWKEQYELEKFPVRLLQMASFSFDVFAGDMARALLNGGQLIVCPNDVKLDPVSLYELIRSCEINIFESTPALIAPLMQHIYEQGLDVSFLRLLILGSDSCPVEEFRKLLNRFGGQMRIINSYGVTEAAIDSSYYEESVDALPAAGSTPIGKPLPNMAYYVLDTAGKLAPIGIAGELHIGGAGVARGYWGREELTADKFIANPYIEGDRLYRTGDLAKWMPDGNMLFLGRDDHQVKVRGYRIELGEIEARLLQHPDIREAVVVAREGADADKYLCAYIVAARQPTFQELQAHLAEALPSYMVPSHLVVLERMPLTPNGKIDRRALPEPAGLQLKATAYAAPATETEKRLVEVLEAVLGTTGIGVNDDFFQLGGHSLKAMSLVSHVHKAFGVALPLRLVFEAPTAAQMARFIDEETGAAAPFAAILPIEARESYELSSAQKRLYILNQIEGAGTSYNMPDSMLLEGPVNPSKVEAAFRALIRRHESLRTSFHMENGEPVQRVHPDTSFQLEVAEGYDADPAQLERLADEFVRPFDLSRAPLLRVGLVKLAEDRHLFLFDMHHIVSDGVSMSIIVNEFAALYADAELPELSVQYKDFAAWQNGLFTSDYLRKQEAYWLEQLSEDLPVLDLPTDYPRPSIQSFEGARLSFGTGSELRDQLNRLAADTGTTLYMVLLSVYNVLLSKYSGQTDLIVGTPTAGRSHADLGGIVGMFVNTLAIRTQMDERMTFRELLAVVKGRLLGAYEHQDYPFELLVEKLGVTRDLSRNPVFDTMFILQNTDEQPFQLEGVTFRPFETEQVMTKFDLTLEATETEEGIEFVLEYATKLFGKATVARMSRQLMQLIRAVTGQPDASIASLSLLSEEEVRQLTVSFNQTATVPPATELLHGLIEERVRLAPELPAIVFGGMTLTYREWNERANRLATTLRTNGAGPERIVAVLANRSADMAVALLAVLKSGAAYVPIDPDYPQERIEYMLADSRADILLTQTGISSAATFGGITFRLDDADSYTGDGADLEHINRPADLAYVIYTSGTTGRPKGVMIEHRSIVNTIVWRCDEYGFAPGDRVLQLLSYAFDAFVGSFFAPMAAGAASVIVRDDEAKDPVALKRYVATERITHFSAVPSLYGALLDMLSPEEAQPLKAVTLGGEKVPPALIAKSAALNPQLKLHNEYGPTESSVVTTILSGLDAGKPVTIGSPIANTRVYIVDSSMQLQPIGVRGELCIAGRGLARGYLNQPELTADKFVPCPWEPGELMYRTGDLARWLQDGTIDFVGRVDHQVKIRGYRIELGEIEASLLQQDEVKEAVVLARSDYSSSGTYLSAYLVMEAGAVVPQDLQSRLARQLPAYMIPSYFIVLEKLPLTPNGKLDTKALPAPDPELMGQRDYAPPEDELEAKLAGLLEELLRDVMAAERVGMTDNFFALGGHSLKAMMLVSQLYREFQVEVPLRTVFETATIRDLAAYIRSAAAAAGDLSLRPAPEAEYYPLSSAQMRLFVLDQLEGAGTGYNMPGVLRLTGTLDRGKLESVFVRLIRRHESLRTSFHSVDAQPMQRVHADAELTFEWMESSEADALQLIEQFVRPFDLAQAPLLRVGAIRLTDRAEEHLLLFDMHHIVSDGVSMSVLIREFVQLYRGDALGELEVQYKDFAVWQQQLFQSETMRKHEAFWLDRFGDELPVLDLSTDAPRPAVRSLEGAYYAFGADAELLRCLNKLAADTGSTLFMVLLAVYKVLLSKYTNQTDVVVGTPISGRTHADTLNLIGMFVNTLPMRSRPESGKTFLEFLEEVKRGAYEAYEHQDYPFETLVEKLQLHRDLSRNPLFDTVFILQNMDREAVVLDGLTVQPYDYENAVSKFDLTLMAIEEEGRLALSWEYSTALFRAETMARMAGHYVQLLREAVSDPTRALAEIDMLSPQEKQQLLNDFNATGTIDTPSETLHGLFELQAAAVPEQTALALGSERMTYGQLNERANRLARTLRDRGVKPECVVGVMAHRSFDMIVGMLAVLKAGGAYMPIDPAYPADRIAYMLDNSEAEFVLAQAELIPADAESTAIWLDLADESLYAGDGADLAPASGPDHLAYIIYTSGTTGKPKGVMIEHRSIARNIWWRKEEYGLTTADSVLQLFSFAFDGFVTSFYTPIVAGSTVVLLGEDDAKNPVSIKDSIVRHGVTHFISVPSLYAGVLECMSEQDAASLRIVTLAGEKVTNNVVALSKAVRAGVEIVNEYGPTESSVVATIERDLQPDGTITIGRPIQGTNIYILGADGQPAPVGVAGELCIAGSGLARGYAQLPDMTAERFVRNPFEPEARMYRTGDAARWLPDGRIDYIGRIDHQVKVRGYRIELGEIEGALLRQTGVKEAVVLALDDHRQQKYLCAYVTADGQVDAAAVKASLGSVLPEYMVPAFIVQLERLPVTPNGKVDRRALPAPDRGSVTDAAAYEAPASEREHVLAGIWQDVLGIERIGTQDHFFHLGGDSIKAIQVAARLNKYGLRLEVRDLFRYPTIAELSPRLQAAQRTIEQGPVEGEAPLTPIQRWFFERQFTDMHYWNQAELIYSKSPLSEASLRQAFRKLTEHHDALRMRFAMHEGVVRQINAGAAEGEHFTLDVIELHGRSEEQVRQSIARHSAAIQEDMDLAHGPLVKLGLFRTEEGDHLLIAIHHLVVDGVSWRILFEDFADAYRQAEEGKPAEDIALPAKTDSYRYWAQQLAEYAASDRLRQEAEYWSKLSDRPVAALPKDHAAGCNLVKHMRSIERQLSSEATDQLLKDANTAYRTEINDLLMTALGLALKDWSGSALHAVNLEGHGREPFTEQVDITRTVGWFTSQYPVVLDMEKTDDLGYTIKLTKESLRRIPNKGVGYGILKYMTRELEGMELTPEISFNYLGQFDSRSGNSEDGDGAMRPSAYDAGLPFSLESERPAPLDVTGIVADGVLKLALHYNGLEYEASTAEALIERFMARLLDVIGHCLRQETSELTPSDLGDDDLTLEELDSLLESIEL
ncbi:non-ribosomal peptide synthase/polyketide synthase [Paenibacillus chartarius]|uniref:Non-ribosomal peptide synthase/polyketide synthase n=1 Tax=Paenibacillus chartarius TaxID=747481 RepID=A0ABV6DTC1_9BACL